MPRSPRLMLLVYALTLFCSATLLFMVELMVGKMILPILGGTPAVWNTCMVFYQAVLLLGYAYAHVSTSWLGARKQAVVQSVLLVLPFVLFVLPIAIDRGHLKGDEHPIFAVLLLLTLSVGLPMFVISATAPLLQKWFASTSHPAAKDPYFLYGASNLGSMLALLAYPVLVEPNLRLGEQSIDWSIGYGVLAALTVLCAVFLWLSPRHEEASANDETAVVTGQKKSNERASESIQANRQGIRGGKRPELAAATETATGHTLSGDVTWWRILRWVALAFVPSSLMLGATTYITTDIASIPMLWVAPLALYLLSFILVFSKPFFQWLSLTIGFLAVCILLLFFIFSKAATTANIEDLHSITRVIFWVPFALGGGSAYAAWRAWKQRDSNLMHRIMVLLMPLLVLGLLFFILSELKTKSHWIIFSLLFHLVTLFVVSMVCHGELARDRPAARHLTGYFLWMSVGGVLGGLFNGLLAPVIFSGIVEYELAMMLACFLAPPLGEPEESTWGRRADYILAGLFVLIGGALIYLRLREKNSMHWELLQNSPWKWQLALLILGMAIALSPILRKRDRQFDHWMDMLLPLFLGVLLIGLSWGLLSDKVWEKLAKLTEGLSLNTYRFSKILTYGVPIVLCYTFVERPLRFALGVGAVLLASGFCGIFDNNIQYQERSFFGVLKVEYERARLDDEDLSSLRLVHGTTLHGMQFLNPERRDEPLTYYHHTGPVGEIMLAYNGHNTPAEKMNVAVIGLGTGTMAAYARPRQHFTFYDIDPVVKRLSFDEPTEKSKPFFTFVQDARERKDAQERGAEMKLVMGDARLTMEKQQLSEAEKYGVIIVDAFSSDAIPVHLITREAIKVYLDKMAEDGVLCFHISNRYLDLKPVLYNLAQDSGLSAVYQSDDVDKDPRSTTYLNKSTSTWVVLARKSRYLDKLRVLNDWEDRRKQFRFELLPLMLWPDRGLGMATQAIFLRNLLDESISQRPSTWDELEPGEKWPDLKKVGVWTDDYSNLLSVFMW